MATLAVVLFHSSGVNAVEARVHSLGDAGGVAPHVQLEIGSDSNPLRSTSGSEEAMYFRLRPSVRYIAENRNNQLSLQYTGNYLQYFEEYCTDNTTSRPGDCPQGSPSFDKASFQDHSLSLNGFIEINKRLRANMGISRSIIHQPLGTGLSSCR